MGLFMFMSQILPTQLNYLLCIFEKYPCDAKYMLGGHESFCFPPPVNELSRLLNILLLSLVCFNTSVSE